MKRQPRLNAHFGFGRDNPHAINQTNGMSCGNPRAVKGDPNTEKA
jgi:hypothetical protein